MTPATSSRHMVTLGMFIIDEFSYMDENGQPTGKKLAPQIGGGGTYASIGARIWLPADKLGMVIDRGNDFPPHIQSKLDSYGPDIWLFRDHPDIGTTRAINSYRGDHRSFDYLTPRIRITPNDLINTKLASPTSLHFICSPSRAASILSEIRDKDGWFPKTIYEPIPDRCIPEELPALIKVLPSVDILSPNAEEALCLLSVNSSPTKESIEQAANKFLEFGIGKNGAGCVIIRSGAMGAYTTTRNKGGQWVDPFWTNNTEKVVDVTGAGNSFLGGLAAGLLLAKEDVYEAAFYATVSAGFTIEQEGLPTLSIVAAEGRVEEWNRDSPKRRLEELRIRHARIVK